MTPDGWTPVKKLPYSPPWRVVRWGPFGGGRLVVGENGREYLVVEGRWYRPVNRRRKS